MAVREGRVPVTVLTGFLGAGKTTLLNRILSESHGLRFGVIVNEFGEIGVDGDLVTGAEEELIEMTNGCVCCTVRGDLIRTARTLLEARDLDALVVETTGLARPGPVAQSFLLDAALSERCALDSITAVADARWIETRLADSAEAQEQIAVADQIVLNKTDLVAAADLDRIEARLRALNPAAPILRAERAGVPVAALLGRGGFDLARLDLPDGRCAEDHVHGPDCGPGHAHDHAHDHAPEGHLSGIDSVSLTEPRPMDAARLETWLGDLLAAEGEHILRAKGIVAVAGEDRRLAIQAVHALFEGDWGRAWAKDEPRASRFVFIGRHLDARALRAGFASCAA